MILIRDITDFVEDEIEGAEEYIEMALLIKEENPNAAKVLYDLARVELTHVDMLHKVVTAEIEKYRKEYGEPPADMQAIYDWQHKKEIGEVKEIKTMVEMFEKS